MKLFPKAAPDPRKQLQDYRSYHPERVRLYVNTIAMRELVAGAEKNLIFTLGITGDDADNWRNSIGPLIAMAKNGRYDVMTGQMGLSMLGGIKMALRVAESSA